jgi:hypothetical protein
MELLSLSGVQALQRGVAALAFTSLPGPPESSAAAMEPHSWEMQDAAWAPEALVRVRAARGAHELETFGRTCGCTRPPRVWPSSWRRAPPPRP